MADFAFLPWDFISEELLSVAAKPYGIEYDRMEMFA